MPHLKAMGEFLAKWQGTPIRIHDLMMYYEAAKTVLKAQNPKGEPTVGQIIEFSKVVVMSMNIKKPSSTSTDS